MSFKEQAAEVLLKLYMLPFNIILNKLNGFHKTTLETKLVKSLNDNDHYVHISFFPKSVEKLRVGRLSERSFRDTAIILQGPVIKEDNFTLDTIILYKKFYSDINIIVSTWENTDEKFISNAKKLGAKVLLNTYPDINGIGNINYQLVTSFAGANMAKELGVKYVWKTRCDQRYYHPCALSCLCSIHSKKKLIFLGGISNSFVKRPFHLSDFMAFGLIEDIINLYSCPLDDEDSTKTRYTHKNQSKDAEGFNDYIKEVKNAEAGITDINQSFGDLPLRYANPETLIAYHYYKSYIHNGADYSETFSEFLDLYQDYLKNHTIIVDADDLGFFWKKYDYSSIRNTYFDRMGKLDYSSWNSL